jgi:hypothetical protein
MFGLHQVVGDNGSLRSLETVSVACALCSRDSTCFLLADIHRGLIRICGECLKGTVVVPDEERLARVRGKLPPPPVFKIYYWDTFDPPGEDTAEIGSSPSLSEAQQWVRDHYGDRLRPSGADHVDIVYNGNVVQRFNVG